MLYVESYNSSNVLTFKNKLKEINDQNDNGDKKNLSGTKKLYNIVSSNASRILNIIVQHFWINSPIHHSNKDSVRDTVSLAKVKTI